MVALTRALALLRRRLLGDKVADRTSESLALDTCKLDVVFVANEEGVQSCLPLVARQPGNSSGKDSGKIQSDPVCSRPLLLLSNWWLLTRRERERRRKGGRKEETSDAKGLPMNKDGVLFCIHLFISGCRVESEYCVSHPKTRWQYERRAST